MKKNRLIDLRIHLNITQKELADSLLLSTSAISLLENNKRCLSARTVKSIVSIYKINENWLLGTSNEMFSNGDELPYIYKQISETLKNKDIETLKAIKKFLELDSDSINSLIPIINHLLDSKKKE